MARKRTTDRNQEWVNANPVLALAAANLRGQAGMSERAIYETMKKEVAAAHVPSYRDLRAAFDHFEVRHGTIGGSKGKRIDTATLKVEDGHSKYRLAYRAQFNAQQVGDLNRKTVVGYLIRASPKRAPDTPEDVRRREAAEIWADPDGYLEWEGSQEYDSTPPF